VLVQAPNLATTEYFAVEVGRAAVQERAVVVQTVVTMAPTVRLTTYVSTALPLLSAVAVQETAMPDEVSATVGFPGGGKLAAAAVPDDAPLTT
jgi:hypothetical protein